MELVVSLEKLFNIDISDKEALKINTVNDCIVIFNKYMIDKLNRDRLVLFESQNNNII
jgi:acyl carrier protein